jgi:hypothetical protein
MSRTKTSTALLLLASIAFAAGCTRNDPTGPSSSESHQLAHGEHQGADN